MMTAPRQEASATRLLDGLAWSVLAIVALVAAFTFRDYGLGWDDYTHSQMGELLLSFYASGFTDRRALSFVNLYMYGGGFDMLAALAAKVSPFDLFETRRLVGAAVGILGLVITWRIGRRVAGPLAGLLALIFLAACPLYYGHMFMNPKDAPFAVAAAFFLLCFIPAIERYPAPSPVAVMMLGIGLGLTIGTRIMGGIIGISAALGLAILVFLEAGTHGKGRALKRLGQFIAYLIPGALIAYLTMALIWPWSVQEPLNPIRAIGYFSNFFEKPWKELFAGSLISVPDMPAIYLPTLLFLKLPEIMVVCALGGLIIAGMRATDSRLSHQQRSVNVVVVAAILVPVVMTVLTRPALYNGVRHFLFLLPPAAVLAGISAAWVIERAKQMSRPLAYAVTAVATLGILSPVVEMVRLHPYQYAHFNRIAGGIDAADKRYMLDYWGLSFKQATQELRSKLAERVEVPPDGRRWKIAVCGPHPPASVALGPQFEATWDSKGADFALTLNAFYCRELDAPVLVEIKREGVVFARAYDIRGRDIGPLLTMPPP